MGWAFQRFFLGISGPTVFLEQPQSSLNKIKINVIHLEEFLTRVLMVMLFKYFPSETLNIEF